jgi:hypothetical protein
MGRISKMSEIGIRQGSGIVARRRRECVRGVLVGWEIEEMKIL